MLDHYRHTCIYLHIALHISSDPTCMCIYDPTCMCWSFGARWQWSRARGGGGLQFNLPVSVSRNEVKGEGFRRERKRMRERKRQKEIYIYAHDNTSKWSYIHMTPQLQVTVYTHEPTCMCWSSGARWRWSRLRGDRDHKFKGARRWWCTIQLRGWIIEKSNFLSNQAPVSPIPTYMYMYIYSIKIYLCM